MASHFSLLLPQWLEKVLFQLGFGRPLWQALTLGSLESQAPMPWSLEALAYLPPGVRLVPWGSLKSNTDSRWTSGRTDSLQLFGSCLEEDSCGIRTAFQTFSKELLLKLPQGVSLTLPSTKNNTEVPNG